MRHLCTRATLGPPLPRGPILRMRRAFFAKSFPAHSLRILCAFTAHFCAIFCTLLNAGCIRLHPTAVGRGAFCTYVLLNVHCSRRVGSTYVLYRCRGLLPVAARALGLCYCINRINCILRSAFTRSFEHLLRVFCALIAHFALCPPILAKYQGAPRFVHSCALLCILCNDVHSSLGGGSCGNSIRMLY